jgi:flagellar hook-associated protein 2
MADITPASMASELANAYVSRAQKTLTAQTTKAQATSTALTKLQSALSAFDTAMAALSSKKSLIQRTATLTGSAATATATASAQPGNYSLFVEQTATKHQVAFEDLPAVPVALGGPLVVQLRDGTPFTVELTLADQNGDGLISSAEIARAINLAEQNDGKVTATTVTTGGRTQLILSSNTSGLGGQITLDASGLQGDLQTQFSPGGIKTPATDDSPAVLYATELSAARDAVVWIGDKGTGIRVQQGSNTFTGIEGVTVTLAQAMADGAAPLQLTVANDDGGTAANLQSFVTAYNALEKALDDLTALGKNGSASAAFASDAGVRSLRNQLANALRLEVDGVSLMSYGIKTSRDGSISLDQAKLDKTLAAKPEGLDALFGSASLSNPSGVLGAFQATIKSWTNSSNGLLSQRQASVALIQKRATLGQERIEVQYNHAYNRYLAQFTKLQNLQSQMGQTSSMFAAMSTSST